MLPGRAYTPATILWILRKRLWLLIVCAITPAALAGWLAAQQPDRFAAYATILVVPPRLAQDVVARPVAPESLEERLLAITPQILNPARLERIITELNLYPELRKVAPMDQVVQAMRASIIGPAVVRADAFTIGYVGFWPARVQQVTERLSEAFIDENVRNREQRAAATSEFLDMKLEDLKNQLVEQERQLQQYRTANASSLPSQLPANLQSLRAAQEELRQMQDLLRRDRDRRAAVEQTLVALEQADPALDAPLDTQPPDTAVAEAGAAAPEPEPAPPAAADAAGSQAGAGTEDPALNVGPPGTPLPIRLRNARRNLDNLRLKWTAAHPDVVRAQRIVAELEKLEQQAIEQASRAPTQPAPAAGAARAARITVARRNLAAIDREIAARVAEETRLARIVGEFQGRVDTGPAHEARLVELTRDYDILRESYRELRAKKEEAGFAADLERQQVGQQFRVIDPPRLPGRPAYPNRPGFVLLGFGLGLAFGLALTAGLELRDRSFRTAPEVVDVLALPVVAMVPAMATRYERRRFYRRLAWGAGALVLALLAGTGLLALRGLL